MKERKLPKSTPLTSAGMRLDPCLLHSGTQGHARCGLGAEMTALREDRHSEPQGKQRRSPAVTSAQEVCWG